MSNRSAAGRQSNQAGPSDPSDPAKRRARHRSRDPLFTGLCLIVIGGAALLEQRGYGLLDWLELHWPVAITALGVMRLLTAREQAQVGSGVFLILLSGWFYACETGYQGMDYFNSWPVLLVGLGLWKLILGGLSLRREHIDKTEGEQQS